MKGDLDLACRYPYSNLALYARAYSVQRGDSVDLYPTDLCKILE